MKTIMSVTKKKKIQEKKVNRSVTKKKKERKK